MTATLHALNGPLYTIATVDDSKKDLPASYRNYVLKRDGVVFGTVKYDHGRWKSAGGPAWCATVERKEHPYQSSIYHKDRKKLLDDVKNLVEGRPLEYCR